MQPLFLLKKHILVQDLQSRRVSTKYSYEKNLTLLYPIIFCHLNFRTAKWRFQLFPWRKGIQLYANA